LRSYEIELKRKKHESLRLSKRVVNIELVGKNKEDELKQTRYQSRSHRIKSAKKEKDETKISLFTHLKISRRVVDIFIKGDVKKEVLENIKGVLSVTLNHDEYEVKIANKDIISIVFDKIKDNKITKFVVEEPTLNEIFVETVGEKYEKEV